MARRRPVEAPPKLPAGVDGGRLPDHLRHWRRYAEHEGLDPRRDMYAAWVGYHAAQSAWLAERGLVAEHGRIDWHRARALGLLRRASDGAA